MPMQVYFVMRKLMLAITRNDGSDDDVGHDDIDDADDKSDGHGHA